MFLPRPIAFVLILLSPLLAASPLHAVCPAAASWISFPEDCDVGDTLATAISALADGGTIDIAPGTYTFGSSGLNVSSRAMTLHARSIGGVTFDGQNTRTLVKDLNNAGSVVFEGIRFVNGLSASGNVAGAVTLTNSEATFADCEFSGNRQTHASTGGGALALLTGARALIVRTTFSGNTAKNNGGAIYAVGDSAAVSAWIHDSQFTSNSTNISGFTATAAGGAIYLRNGRVAISDSRFDGNSAGWVGGAIYAWGDWAGSPPYCNYDGAPKADVVLSRSELVGNQGNDSANPGARPDQTYGGAVHLENCARARIYESRFDGNEAGWGGAVSADHAKLVVDQTVFRFNRARVGASSAIPVGGAISFHAVDPASTPDYPNGELVLDHVLLEGGLSGDATATNAELGGCLYVAGDDQRSTPVPPSARVTATISNSAFYRCNVASLTPSSSFIWGGGIYSDRTNLDVTDSVFIENRANGQPSGTNGLGAGIALLFDSLGSFQGDVVIAGSTSNAPPQYADSVDLAVALSDPPTGSVEEWTESPPSVAGMVVAAPSQAAGAGGPYVGEAVVGWAYAGSAATLDGNSLGSMQGTQLVTEGAHGLVVSGLGSCSRCSAAVQAPLEPTATLTANPSIVANPGDASTLDWTTPDGTLLAAFADRGIGETGATGNAILRPGSSQTYRRLVVTEQGGVLSERTIIVGSAPPPDWIWSDGFESGDVSAWSAAVP